MYTYLASICELNNIRYISSHAVSGGDINACFVVNTNDGCLFLKLNSATKYPEMFTREAEGLRALAQAGQLLVPKVVATGVLDDQQYLLLEWLEKVTPGKDLWTALAHALYELHTITKHQFGWPSSNYIGSLVQYNQLKQTWAEFYATQRIMPLVEQLFQTECFAMKDVKAAERLCVNLATIFPDEPPALVHGDLWGGNFMAVRGSKAGNKILPSVFDPAVYFGHREMDLGMTLLFGGFDVEFYNVYNEIGALEKNWRKRETLTQLYPLLVHAVLFGGNYVSRCKSIINEWS